MADKNYSDFSTAAYDPAKIILQADASTGALTKLLNSDFNLLKVKTTRLTNAQILTLPTTAVDIIPAPGSGLLLLPFMAFTYVSSTGAAYTNITNASWSLRLGSGYLSSPLLMQGHLANTAVKLLSFLIPINQPGSGDFTGINVTNAAINTFINQPLTIVDDWDGVSNYTGGNAANFADITVLYTIIQP